MAGFTRQFSGTIEWHVLTERHNQRFEQQSQTGQLPRPGRGDQSDFATGQFNSWNTNLKVASMLKKV